MFILEVLGFYLACGLSMYVYAVVHNFGVMGTWNFKITKTHVALYEYPRFMLFWLHWVVKKVS
jgi:hypothetical protein